MYLINVWEISSIFVGVFVMRKFMFVIQFVGFQFIILNNMVKTIYEFLSY